jgi:hypothetical protein
VRPHHPLLAGGCRYREARDSIIAQLDAVLRPRKKGDGGPPEH